MDDELAAPISPDDATARLLDAAQAIGIEIDREEAERWIAAVSAESAGMLTVDVDTGVYGHRITMEDHDAADLARFRRMARVVGFEDRLPHVTTALALSGSAAQARIHRFPADADFFERVHVQAPTRETACQLLGEVIRDKALATMRGEGHRLQEVKFGNWPVDGTVNGRAVKHGQSVTWRPAEVEAGSIAYVAADGTAGVLRWEDAAHDPGWCKLDWVIADAGDRKLVNASNMLDATWEAPDGTITPLDGFLDPYYQEVYLETESIPLFSRLVKELGADSVADYVEQLVEEVYKYTVKEPNFGKASRRLYNIFRITGRYPEAAYIRELFDEPVTALYQVGAILRTLDEAAGAGDAFATEGMVTQIDGLIMSAIGGLEGSSEAEMVRRLLGIRDAFTNRAELAIRDEDIVAAQEHAMREVNAYFERVLMRVPSIQAYLEEIASTHTAT
ncbi:MAG TPA: hypothetical protein VMQ65_09605 [Candidatus Limnocylindria bacterium]|nr:hypothetical protein [Candidatus Limnocylindria bacterium]